MKAETPRFPFSAVVATKERAQSLRRTFGSLAKQSLTPDEIIVVDASADLSAEGACKSAIESLQSEIRWVRAEQVGAASQRSQGVELARHDAILFFDDDIVFEPECVLRLAKAMAADADLGGVNATITNQTYQAPGAVSRFVFTFMHGAKAASFAGKIIGPAVNLLPEDNESLPEVVPVEWLNTTCTMYRRTALPDPVFDPFFTGYSLMEDVALSLHVSARGWKLANVRTARIFHDSQPADYKSHVRARAAMELINRHYVMSRILGRSRFADYTKLLGWELFQLASCAANRDGRRSIGQHVAGKLEALRTILSHG